jgi:hypothetical protein
MRGNDITQGALFSYVSLEEGVPKTHPLRGCEFEARYSHTPRPKGGGQSLPRT